MCVFSSPISSLSFIFIGHYSWKRKTFKCLSFEFVQGHCEHMSVLSVLSSNLSTNKFRISIMCVSIKCTRFSTWLLWFGSTKERSDRKMCNDNIILKENFRQITTIRHNPFTNCVMLCTRINMRFKFIHEVVVTINAIYLCKFDEIEFTVNTFIHEA